MFRANGSRRPVTYTSRMKCRRVSLMSNGPIHLSPQPRSLLGVRILGSGSYVPELVVTNQDLRETHGFDRRVDRQPYGDS